MQLLLYLQIVFYVRSFYFTLEYIVRMQLLLYLQIVFYVRSFYFTLEYIVRMQVLIYLQHVVYVCSFYVTCIIKLLLSFSHRMTLFEIV